MKYSEIYEKWLSSATADPDLILELLSVKDDEAGISDRFYRELEFGTAGLRGIIGAGTNRMNVYTVGRASQGIADYVNEKTSGGAVAVSYDSRIKSRLFAETAASVFAANGITCYMYDELMPTPMLSFAVRYYGCNAGVMITASHNPAKYNGYKAYGSDGCQFGPEDSDRVFSFIRKTDFFGGIKTTDFDEGVRSGKIKMIGNDCIEAFLKCSESQAISRGIFEGSDFSVVYTPLHGTGNKPVREILRRIGVKNITVVKEQELPDGNFPTAPYPNPELRQPFECALALAEKIKPDILLGTDPDADRVGIAVQKNGNYELMTGNQVGILLLDYILKRRKELGTLPERSVAVKSIVTSDICIKIAEKYGCELRNVLTGFKFIGEQIASLEAEGHPERYVLGFEESYGYLVGTFVRDKDAVTASMLICEMACYYKKNGMTLFDALEEIEKEHGFYTNSQKGYTFEGQSGMAEMKNIMKKLTDKPIPEIAGKKVLKIINFKNSTAKDTVTGKVTAIPYPSSDVTEFVLEGESSLIVRPSGTEPKIKVYISAIGKTKEASLSLADALKAAGDEMMKS